jgi:hypothetical protein
VTSLLGGRLHRLGFWALVAVGLVLGFRGFVVAREAVFSRPTPRSATVATSGNELLLNEITARDSIVLEARACARDPFLPPPPPASDSKGIKKPDQQPQVIVTPALVALLYDNVAPSVQLRLRTFVSPWLNEGDSFQGWTVARITPDSVVVSMDGKNRVLKK